MFAGVESTGPISFETAEVEPSLLVAVTFERTFAAASSLVSVYVAAVAPEMSAKPEPESRCHW